MSKRSECTIFLITESEVVRADFAGRRKLKLVDFQKHSRDVSLTASESLQLVLGGKRKAGRNCLVFETSVWSQVVSVPQRSIEDIQPEELQNALKFEVETLSGVDAEYSALGIFRLQDDNLSQASFWINVANRDLFESVSQTLKSKGAKWVSLAHPAGFAGDRSRTTKRIELWENVAILMDGKSPQTIAGLTPHWLEQLGLSGEKKNLDRVSILVQNSELIGEETEISTFRSLENEEALRSWLTSAARRGQSETVNTFPLVKTFDRVVAGSALSTTFYRLIAVVLVGLFCFAHWSWLEQNQKKVDQEIARLEAPAKDKRGFDQQLAQTLEQRSNLELDSAASKARMKKIEYLLEFQKGRLGKLLEQLKILRTTDLVINEIRLHEKGIVVSGLTLKSKSAHELAAKLTDVAKSTMGWDVNPASQVGKNQLKDGGPYEFSILLEDVGPGQRLANQSQADKTSRSSAGKL